jgi:hypothetical protein
LVSGKIKHRETAAIAASTGCGKRSVNRRHRQNCNRCCAKTEQTSSQSRSRDR